jgi:hypothetical protein
MNGRKVYAEEFIWWLSFRRSIDRIDNMFVIGAKPKPESDQRTRDFAESVVAVGRVLSMGDVMWLLLPIASGYKYRIFRFLHC